MTTPGGLAVQREYEGRLWGLYRYALANGLTTADDIFARAASQGRYSADELIALVTQLSDGDRRQDLAALVESLLSAPLRRLVLLLANQPQRPTGEADAAAILLAMAAHAGDTLGEVERMALLDLLSAQGRRADVDRFIADFKLGRKDVPQLSLLRANASHPFRTGTDDDHPAVEAWLKLVNRAYLDDGLEPIGLAPGREAPIDRILCAPSSLVEGGPLVTIIMPTYNPGPSLATALESLIAQSYRNLEILVVDDGSTAAVTDSLSRWEARDPRIKVVLLGENRGPYAARNAALSQYAHGDFVTVHDDDDWSHPRKIELQVAHLEAEPDLAANMSLTARATPDLWFVRRSPAPKFVHPNYSSLLIRRSVMTRLGYWDLVNRAADGELRDRIIAASGHPVPGVGRAPASIVRVRPESLSFGEINKGYVDPRRRWYTMAHQHWHKQAAARGEELYVPADDSSARPFPAPVAMLGRRGDTGPVEVDILYATDYRFPGGNSTLACTEIGMLLDHGFTVGLLQVDSPVLGSSGTLHPRAFELGSHPAARLLTPLDAATAPLTIVRHPTVLQFVGPSPFPISTRQVVLIVNHTPINPDGESAPYDIAAVVANCRATLGRTPVVAPESGLMRRLLEGLVDPDLLSADDWNGVVRVSPAEPRAAVDTRPPRVGRHSRDHQAKWPAAEVLELVYPTDGSRDVRILGGAEFAEKRLGRPVAAGWTVYPFGSKPVAEFLAELDFWVYFHGPELYESFGMATLEAMAAGLVVILPPTMQDTFGEGAVYAEPADVADLIDALWADPHAYAAQSGKAIRTVRDRFGQDALLARVERYLPRG